MGGDFASDKLEQHISFIHATVIDIIISKT